MANWYDMLKEEMEDNGDTFENRVCTMDEEGLKKKFDAVCGSIKGKPFTAWGENWVYFPLCHDGWEWVGSAPRNPCDIKMGHQGCE